MRRIINEKMTQYNCIYRISMYGYSIRRSCVSWYRCILLLDISYRTLFYLILNWLEVIFFFKKVNYLYLKKMEFLLRWRRGE